MTVNWNGRQRLQDLLPSLGGLGCREILVVDNASQDDSVEFLRSRHPEVRVLENPLNQGFAQPCNLGAREARGSVVAFINNDMRAAPGWIDAALGHLDSETPCVASRILDWSGERVDFNGSSLQYLGYALQKDVGALAKELAHDSKALFACGGAMLIDRRLFLELGGFDEHFFAIYEDVDLGWRLWIAGYQVAFAPDSIVHHRGHATFQTQPNEKMRFLMHRNALLTILKNYDDEAFLKILPLAFALAVKRAVLFSGVSKDSFHLWADTRERLRLGDDDVRDRLLDALNHLVAVEDVLDSLPRVLGQRRAIAPLRRRSDRELVGMFGDPLRAIVMDPEYLERELAYLECAKLDWLLDVPGLAERAPDLPDRLESKLDGLRRELAAWRWTAGLAASSPPSPSPPSAATFFRIWRRQGFRQAWTRLLERVDRGL